MKIENYCRDFVTRVIPEDVEKTRTIEFIASNNSRDSHGTVLPVDKWDLSRYAKNGLVTYQHSYYSSNPDMVIGRGVARIENNELIVAITFETEDLNPIAEKIFRKILAGTINAVSVMFAPTQKGYWGTGEEAENGSKPTYYYNGQELLDVSVVTLPSNADALRRGLQGIVDKHGNKVENMTVGEFIRAIEMSGNSEENESNSKPGEQEKQRSIDDAILLAEAMMALNN